MLITTCNQLDGYISELDVGRVATASASLAEISGATTFMGVPLQDVMQIKAFAFNRNECEREWWRKFYALLQEGSETRGEYS